MYRKYEMPFDRPIAAQFEMEFPSDSISAADHLHFHSHLEIGYCYYGSGAVTLGNEKFLHGSNTFTIIPQNIPHMTENNDKIGCSWEYLMIDVDEFLSTIYRDNSPLSKRLISGVNCRPRLSKAEDQQEIAELIRTILRIMREQENIYLEEARGLILALLVRVARWNTTLLEDGALHIADNSTIISPALDYISREPEHPFRIKELARICHISETHFRRVFEEHMKMSPVKYINHIRIRRACYELKRTDDPINTIAAKSGFTTLSTFNRNFRQITGISPLQFRKQPDLYDPDYLEKSFYK